MFRGGFGMGYDVLFYNLLTVNGSNYPRIATASINNVLDIYPNLLQAGGSAVFSPLNAYTNSPADTVNPDSKFWSFSIARELGDFVAEVGYTGSRSGHGINQIHANPSVLTREQAALVAATQNANAIPSVQARRVYPQYGVRTLIPAYVGPADNDVEARSEYNGVYVQLSKRFSHGLQFATSYTRSKFESNNDASLGETGTDGSSQRTAELLRLRGGLERVAVRRAEPLRGELPLGGPGAEVGSAPPHPGRLAVLGRHGLPVGPAVHDRDGRRLERRRDHRVGPPEPRQRRRRVGRRAPGLHEQRLRRRSARHQQPAAGQRARRRHRSAATASVPRPTGTPTSAC